MEETRKRLRRKNAGSSFNYADVLVLTMESWMPYLCLQNMNRIMERSPSEYTWDSIKCLRILCKPMVAAWETLFYVKLHIDVQYINRFQLLVPTESLTFLRSDDTSHRILMYGYRQHGDLTHYAVVTMPWKSLLILQQSEDFGKTCNHKRYDWRDYVFHWQVVKQYDWRDYEDSWKVPKIGMRPLVFQDVWYENRPKDTLHWYHRPGDVFNQYDEVTRTIFPLQFNSLSRDEEAARFADIHDIHAWRPNHAYPCLLARPPTNHEIVATRRLPNYVLRSL